jgi:hypothetical protein
LPEVAVEAAEAVLPAAPAAVCLEPMVQTVKAGLALAGLRLPVALQETMTPMPPPLPAAALDLVATDPLTCLPAVAVAVAVATSVVVVAEVTGVVAVEAVADHRLRLARSPATLFTPQA